MRAALEVFARHGYDGASVAEVAAHADISKAVLYDHFASKQELYEELLRSEMDTLYERVAAASAIEAPAEERLRAAIDAYFAYVERRPEVQRLMVTGAGESEIVAACDRVRDESTTAIGALLAAEPSLLRGDPERELTLDVMARTLVSGMDGLATWWTTRPDIPRESIVDSAMRLFWVGLDRLQDVEAPSGDGEREDHHRA